MEKILVIGGCGNVGRGIVEALTKAGITPLVLDKSEGNAWQNISAWSQIFSEVKSVVYACEVGNRELYAGGELTAKNNKNFELFIRKVHKFNPIVWYIGGSWTKRAPIGHIITSKSKNKNIIDAIPYEIAKISAENNAKRLSKRFNIKIRFIDWISVVPNYSENFSIIRMLKEGASGGTINYSKGEVGRPLLDSVSAGEILIYYMKHDTSALFRRLLIPGIFIKFEAFAHASQKALKDRGIGAKLIANNNAPDSLKTKILITKYLRQIVNKKRVLAALYLNAQKAI